MTDHAALNLYRFTMETAHLSPETIDDRVKVLRRLKKFLNGTVMSDSVTLLEADAADLAEWQTSIRQLHGNTIRSYVSHVQQFYRWALDSELIDVDPSRRLIRTRIAKGVPHPIRDEDLIGLFIICIGPLRLVFALAAFAGLRAGEIARLQRQDVDLNADWPNILVRGKGARERRLPILSPLADEIISHGQHSGPLLVSPRGRAYTPDNMSRTANKWLHDVLGTDSTLHSLRHWFATNTARLTKNPLLVRDLLGHSSVSTTEIYMQTAFTGREELADMARLAERVSGKRHLTIVKENKS